jgi:hypothetical protein
MGTNSSVPSQDRGGDESTIAEACAFARETRAISTDADEPIVFDFLYVGEVEDANHDGGRKFGTVVDCDRSVPRVSFTTLQA